MSLGSRVGLIVVAALLGLSVACLLPSDHGKACGDGFVDFEVGEDCDPALSSSFEGRCGGPDMPLARTLCNASCEIECRFCGDGLVGGDEECDPAADLPACPGSGTVACVDCKLDWSGCTECGNAVLEAGEECEYDLQGITTTEDRDCAGQPVPGNPGKTFTAGTRTCNPDCTWSMSNCSLCGDGTLQQDDLTDGNGNTIYPAEACDGNAFTVEATTSICASNCPSLYEGVVCDVECDKTCALTVPNPGDPRCCLLAGAPQPPGAPPCCCELNNPDDPDACILGEAPAPGDDPICPFPS